MGEHSSCSRIRFIYRLRILFIGLLVLSLKTIRKAIFAFKHERFSIKNVSFRGWSLTKHELLSSKHIPGNFYLFYFSLCDFSGDIKRDVSIIEDSKFWLFGILLYTFLLVHGDNDRLFYFLYNLTKLRL